MCAAGGARPVLPPWLWPALEGRQQAVQQLLHVSVPACIRRWRGLGALRGARASLRHTVADGSMGVPICLSCARGHASRGVVCVLASCCSLPACQNLSCSPSSSLEMPHLAKIRSNSAPTMIVSIILVACAFRRGRHPCKIQSDRLLCAGSVPLSIAGRIILHGHLFAFSVPGVLCLLQFPTQ